MFNARQHLRLFPTPTDADWLRAGSRGVQLSQCLSVWLGLPRATLPLTLNPPSVSTGAAAFGGGQREAIPDISLWTCFMSFLILITVPRGVMASVLQVRRLRFREVKFGAQGNMVEQGLNSSPGSPAIRLCPDTPAPLFGESFSPGSYSQGRRWQ